jgi:hypothetical protein
MGLIIEGLFALALVIVVFWLISLYHSFTRDRVRAAQELREQQESEKRAAQEARLLFPGEPLQCLSCGTTFAGPLPDTGCPYCHIASFVVAAADQPVQDIGFRRKGQ